MTYLSNPRFDPDHFPGESMLNENAGSLVSELVSTVFDYQPTPLVDLPALAAQAGVASVQIKDEGNRLGLKSFKALGGAYAVIKLACAEAARALGRPIALDELPRPASGSLDVRSDCGLDTTGSVYFHAVASKMIFACATDGNHGQSVAAGARLIGAKAVIFVHEGVSDRRRMAISRLARNSR